MNKKIYVITHKFIKLNLDKIYTPLLVGSYNKKDIKNILRDDTGKDNISNKNQNYCELTGLYWIWKNSNDDIIGICHYRRFLSKFYYSNNSKYYLDGKDIDELFNKYNLILPKRFYYKGSVKSNFKVAPNLKDMEILRDVINEISPEYLNAFDEYVNRQYTYFCNIMITTKELLNEYCDWLFKILYKMEETLNPEDYLYDDYRRRMFGFLSERLLNIWVIKNKEKLKIKEVSMINTSDNLKNKIKHKICQIRNILFYKN